MELVNPDLVLELWNRILNDTLIRYVGSLVIEI
jgi:hypothetical protein